MGDKGSAVYQIPTIPILKPLKELGLILPSEAERKPIFYKRRSTIVGSISACKTYFN